MRAYLRGRHPLRPRRGGARRAPALLRRGRRESGLLPDDARAVLRRGPASPRAGGARALDTLLARAADGERLSARRGGAAARGGVPLRSRPRRRRRAQAQAPARTSSRTSSTGTSTTRTSARRAAASARSTGRRATPRLRPLARGARARSSQEVVDAGGVQILLQGGLNPELAHRVVRGPLPLDQARVPPRPARAVAGGDPLRSRELEGLTDAGGRSRACTRRASTRVPGGGAEILVDRVRRRSSHGQVHERRVARRSCARRTRWGSARRATMMYGTVDTPRDRVNHLLKIRDLQDETGGFTAFFCWDFQHEQGTRDRGRATPGRSSTCGSRRSRASCSTTSTTSGPRGSPRGRRSGRSRCASAPTISAA